MSLKLLDAENVKELKILYATIKIVNILYALNVTKRFVKEIQKMLKIIKIMKKQIKKISYVLSVVQKLLKELWLNQNFNDII